MSSFKLKPEKTRHAVDIKTLDETHTKVVEEFKKKRQSLPKKKDQLNKLKDQLKELELKPKSEYTNKEIKLRSKLKTDIHNLEDEIYDIENNVSEIEYYSKTDDLLMDYYNLIDHGDNELYEENPELSEIKDDSEKKDDVFEKLDRLNKLKKKKRKKKKVTKRRKRKFTSENSNSITNYFGLEHLDEKKDENEKSRAKLFEQYRIITDNEYHSEKLKNNRQLKKCPECDREKTLNHSEGIYVCEECGIFEMAIIESEKPNYKDSTVPEKPGYPYKRINHFSEWLSQIQAKESTEIPKSVYDMIINELDKQRFKNLKNLTLPYMKTILKKLNLTQYYEHTSHIISKLSKLPPPSISREKEELLRKRFRQIQVPFEKNCPKGRVNFLSYSYILHKFCLLEELDDFVQYFPLLKSPEKLRMQDKIWKAICKDLKWQYIPSI